MKCPNCGRDGKCGYKSEPDIWIIAIATAFQNKKGGI